MGNVQIDCTKTDLYWMHCQLCHIDGPRTEDLEEAERQRVEHHLMHQLPAAEPEPEPGRCPECHMPLTMHHDPGCGQPCGPCEARKASVILQNRLDGAEASVRRVREWLNLMADRGPESLLLAREVCLILKWDAPGPGSPVCVRCGAAGPVHAVHY